MSNPKPLSQVKPLPAEFVVAPRFEIREPNLSPDGSTFVCTLPVGKTRHLFTMDANGGLPSQITTGNNGFSQPSWSPDGRMLVAASGGGIWVMAPDGTQQRCLSHHAAGDEAPLWSADGKFVFFSSRRRGWNQWFRIPSDGSAKAVQLTPMARDFDGGRPSPDGKWFACAAQSRELVNRFEVWIFPADGQGEGRCLTPPGEFWETAPEWEYDSKHLLITSEDPQDGWARLTRVAIDQPLKQRKALSAGDIEDMQVVLSADRKHFAYLRFVDGTHVVHLGSAGSDKMVRVEHPIGHILLVGFAPDAKSLYLIRQTPVELANLVRIDLSDGRSTSLTTSHFPGVAAQDWCLPTRVHYTGREGNPLEGWLYAPRGASASTPAPLIIRVHGGPYAYARYDFNIDGQVILSHGYGIFEIDYRGSTGHGRAHRRGHYGRWGDADTLDMIDGALWACKNVPWVRRESLAIWGGSYGGYIVYCAITREPELFRCATASCGDSELAESFKHGDRPGRTDLLQGMGDPEENREAYKRSSPLYKVEDIQTPVLISHSKQDRSVVPLMSQLLIEALTAHGKVFDAKFYDNPDHMGIGHGTMTDENSTDVMVRRLKFLDKHLRGDGSETLPTPP